MKGKNLKENNFKMFLSQQGTFSSQERNLRELRVLWQCQHNTTDKQKTRGSFGVMRSIKDRKCHCASVQAPGTCIPWALCPVVVSNDEKCQMVYVQERLNVPLRVSRMSFAQPADWAWCKSRLSTAYILQSVWAAQPTRYAQDVSCSMRNNCQMCALPTKHFWKELDFLHMCCTGGLCKHRNNLPGSGYLYTAVPETYAVSLVILPPSWGYPSHLLVFPGHPYGSMAGRSRQWLKKTPSDLCGRGYILVKTFLQQMVYSLTESTYSYMHVCMST